MQFEVYLRSSFIINDLRIGLRGSCESGYVVIGEIKKKFDRKTEL